MNKKIGILFLVLAVIFCFPMTAMAYIDPSVTSYTLQAIAGVVIALSVVIGIVVRRIKSGAKKILKVEERTSKEVEEDVHFTSDDE